jgi:hypothetical protein
MTAPLRIGNEEFWLSVGDAAEVQRLCVTDRQAGLSLARRRAQKASVRVSMMMMDAAQAPAPSPSLASPQLKGPVPMATHTKTAIGDETLYADARVVAELERLRGENAALKAMRDGAVQPPAGQPVMDAQTAVRLAARDAFRAQEAARTDPSTPRGRYIEHLKNAHLGNRG